MPLKESTNKELDPQQLDALFTAIGWHPRGAEKWKEVLSKSSFVYSLCDQETLVAFGRIMEDGVMCMFYDVAVHPDEQHQGLGTKVMEALIEQVKEKDYASIGLFAWEENEANASFYGQFGFKRVGTGMELTKYMKRE